jgi:acetyl esterase/lipase
LPTKEKTTRWYQGSFATIYRCISASHQPAVTKFPDVVAGRPFTSISNVSSPTMTIFGPERKNAGAAMIVFPGGGFQILAIDLEGTEICDWVTANGMTCVLLKYRVPGTAQYYDAGCKCAITPNTPAASAT